jgi:hypothetical protein
VPLLLHAVFASHPSAMHAVADLGERTQPAQGHAGVKSTCMHGGSLCAAALMC